MESSHCDAEQEEMLELNLKFPSRNNINVHVDTVPVKKKESVLHF